MLNMGLWEMVAIIIVAGIIGEIIKTYTKRHASRKELVEIRDTLTHYFKPALTLRVFIFVLI